MLPESWFKVDKGAQNVCFMTEAMLLMKTVRQIWKIRTTHENH